MAQRTVPTSTRTLRPGKANNSKFDYAVEKALFFTSDIDEVKKYWLEKHQMYNSGIATMTKGWTEDKKKWKRETTEKFLAVIQEKEIKDNAAALQNIMAGFKMKVDHKNKIQKLTIKQLAALWNVFMTMNGRPTRIMKQQFDDKNPLTINFSDEAKKRLDKYKDDEKN